MYHKVLQLLNIKPSESAVVRKLFTIQFFLGVATAFLFTSSLTMFIQNYEIKVLPVSYILSACLLFVFNRIYAFLEHRLTSPKLLQVIILFSAISILLFWMLLTLMPFKQLPLIIAGFYMLIYMLVGYAFWGMASIIFNVRESKRLFSIVGAGDIPAKMLGYFSVTAMVPFIGINNLLWVSIASFVVALVLLKRFEKTGLLVEADPNAPSHSHDHKPEHSIHTSGFLTKFFDNRLVLSIALLSLVSYVVFSFIDFTFLSDVKVKYHHSEQIATFIAIFFAIGRLFAMGIKILFSSRMISRIGLTNALLVTPLLLLAIDFFIIISGDRIISSLYIFGFMVLLTEILRSALQEPVFFILFQPLKPHDRLRGHLIAKGHTLPFALVGVGTFLVLYFRANAELPIAVVGQLLVVLLLIWVSAVFIIKKQYLHTLITSLKKGYFTGAELFLNDPTVTGLLVAKTESKKPLEVIHSLNLLERSGFSDLYKLLLKNLHSPVFEINEYILSRIIANNMIVALPMIKQQLKTNKNERLRPKLVKAIYFLDKDSEIGDNTTFTSLQPELQKAAMEGLLLRREPLSEKYVVDQLMMMTKQTLSEKMLALDVVFDCQCENYTTLLSQLLKDNDTSVYKKAIEAAGKVKDATLLPEVFEVVQTKKAYSSLKKCVLYFGDAIYAKDNRPMLTATHEILEVVIKTAGNIKGELSNSFLIDLLEEKNRFSDDIVEALWLKKTKLTKDNEGLVNDWVNEKTEQSKYKVACYYEVDNSQGFTLLKQAIMMEMQRDAQLILKAFALLYDREKVDRVIQLLAAANTSKISNAIEILELIIPKKYFTQLNTVVELIDDVQHNKQLLRKTTGLPVKSIIEEVIHNNRANFTEWTKSVAFYMIPKLKKSEISAQMLNVKDVDESYLFSETKNYVLSVLN